MSHPTPASLAAAPSQPQPGTIPVTSLPPVLAAHRAASMAAGYLERGCLPAARRQLVRALDAVNQAQQGGAA
jgi:hypothetical protein